MTRKALGRGLNALLQTVESTTTGLEQVRLDRIDPARFSRAATFLKTRWQNLPIPSGQAALSNPFFCAAAPPPGTVTSLSLVNVDGVHPDWLVLKPFPPLSANFRIRTPLSSP